MASKVDWAEDIDDSLAAPSTPEVTSVTDPSTGIMTTTEIRVLPDGKRVKVTRRFRRVLHKQAVNHVVAERKQWAKFGAEKGKPAGPDRQTTVVGENVVLKLSQGNKAGETEKDEDQALRDKLKSKKIVCRLCKGEHFTSKCPYKATLGDLDTAADSLPPAEDGSTPGPGTPAEAPGASAGGKYVPPSMRAGGNRAGATMDGARNRDEMPTLRVTNVSEDTQEDDLRDIFGRFGRVHRVFIGRDRETGQSKGFAFVSFENRSEAEKAMQKVHGMGYDNLILSVQWSQPREKPAGGA